MQSSTVCCHYMNGVSVVKTNLFDRNGMDTEHHHKI